MPSFRIPVLGLLFVSLRPSLIRFPQLFLRCWPSAFAFGLFCFSSAFFRPLPFYFRLLGLCFFLSVLPGSASQRLPRRSVSAYAFTVSPVLPGLVSHAFVSRFSYSAFCSFPFILPGFAPTAVPPVLPFFSAFASFPGFSLSSAFFRPLRFGSDYSAFRLFFSPLPDLP